MEERYILHTGKGVQIVTESQAINNALDQEKSGVIPRYSFRDYKTGENLHRPDGLYSQLLRTVAALFTADMTKK